MSLREDWTRIAQSIHSLISTFKPSPMGASGNTCNSMIGHPKIKPVATFVRATINPRFLAEIERKRNPAYMSSLRRQIR